MFNIIFNCPSAKKIKKKNTKKIYIKDKKAQKTPLIVTTLPVKFWIYIKLWFPCVNIPAFTGTCSDT